MRRHDGSEAGPTPESRPDPNDGARSTGWRSCARRLTGMFVGSALLLLAASSAGLAQDVPFKVYITHLMEMGEIEGSSVDPGDWYAKVTIDGVTRDNHPACSETTILGGLFRPFSVFKDFARDPSYCPRPTPWVFTELVPSGQEVAVKIRIFDDDSLSGDDEGDAKPGPGRSIELVVDPDTGRWSGDYDWPQNCSRDLGDRGNNVVRVCWQVSFDSDGDGLLDVWERSGMDTDEDGVIDLDLPAMGADPMHKDLFVELDYMESNDPLESTTPSVYELELWKSAFAAAPIDAGGVPNPDGEPGINLWVDTGGPLNALGVPAGDDLGGGEQIPFTNVSFLNETFYDLRATNFDPRRRYVFRYGLIAARPTNRLGTSTGGNGDKTLIDMNQSWVSDEWGEDGSEAKVRITGGKGRDQIRKIVSNTATTLTVDEDWDPVPDATSEYEISLSGGWGETGGNDFLTFTRNAPTLMHELGHNLRLSHGGAPRKSKNDEDENCKPNYVSVMSYDHYYLQRHTSPFAFIDFSPPRHLDGTRSSDLPPALDESDLDERVILDPDDPDTMFVFTTLGSCVGGSNEGAECVVDADCNSMSCIGDKILREMNAPADWDDDGIIGAASYPVNIDNRGNHWVDDDYLGPAACKNDDLDVLESHDDWANIILPFLQYGDEAAGPVNLFHGPEPTEEDILRRVEGLNTADLSVKQAAPATVEVGGSYQIILTLENAGPNPAFLVEVIDTLPPSTNLSASSSNGTCIEDPAGILTCELDPMLRGDLEIVELEIATTGDVCVDGEPQTLTNLASVANISEHAGEDLDPTDNSSSLTVEAVDTTPPVIEELEVDRDYLWPPNHEMVPVSVTAVATDLCDDDVTCRITEVLSDEPTDGRGDGRTRNDWKIVDDLEIELRAERNGGADGRVYEILVECLDGSGNSVSGTLEVVVPQAIGRSQYDAIQATGHRPAHSRRRGR